MKVIKNCFEEIISPNNLWRAWLIYRVGKRKRRAVLDFERKLEENLLSLRQDLIDGSYQHGQYYQFIVHDPKTRLISAPSVRDHLVHQAVANVLAPYFENYFSPFSFSCRKEKGVDAAIKIFQKYLRQVSNNGRQQAWILHGDIEKCFDSISHKILIDILKRRIHCRATNWLLEQIISSYQSSSSFIDDSGLLRRGIPLGNLTSQLFINVYLDNLDRFVKEKVLIKKYIRYADDFLLVLDSRHRAEFLAEQLRDFLWQELALRFPASHQRIVSLAQGVEVLGMKFLLGYQKIRPATRRHALKRFAQKINQYRQQKTSLVGLNNSWQSFRGLLIHGCNYKVKNEFLNLVNSLCR